MATVEKSASVLGLLEGAQPSPLTEGFNRG